MAGLVVVGLPVVDQLGDQLLADQHVDGLDIQMDDLVGGQKPEGVDQV